MNEPNNEAQDYIVDDRFITPAYVEKFLKDVIEDTKDEDENPINGVPDYHVHTYEEKGILTKDHGLVITFDDGTEFQITIKRSK